MKWYVKVILLGVNFAIIFLMFMLGIKSVISFFTGVFVGAMAVMYWAMTKNKFMSGLFQLVWSDLDAGNTKNKSGKKRK